MGRKWGGDNGARREMGIELRNGKGNGEGDKEDIMEKGNEEGNGEG